MKEYIKKFESASNADGYIINDIPFTSTIGGSIVQNLTCNQEGKKFVVEGGQVVVEDAVNLLSLTIEGSNDLSITIQYEEGMTWRQWYESKYCTPKNDWIETDNNWVHVDGWGYETGLSARGYGNFDSITYYTSTNGGSNWNDMNRIVLNSIDDIIDNEHEYYFQTILGVVG